MCIRICIYVVIYKHIRAVCATLSLIVDVSTAVGCRCCSRAHLHLFSLVIRMNVVILVFVFNKFILLAVSREALSNPC